MLSTFQQTINYKDLTMEQLVAIERAAREIAANLGVQVTIEAHSYKEQDPMSNLYNFYFFAINGKDIPTVYHLITDESHGADTVRIVANYVQGLHERETRVFVKNQEGFDEWQESYQHVIHTKNAVIPIIELDMQKVAITKFTKEFTEATRHE